MAIAGQSTGGFNVTVAANGYTLLLAKCTTLSNLCVSVELAIVNLEYGATALIQASDSDKLRYAWIERRGLA